MVLLLARTHYSLLTAPASPRAWCEEAVRRSLSHLVLTDTNALYGFVGAPGLVGAGIFCAPGGPTGFASPNSSSNSRLLRAFM